MDKVNFDIVESIISLTHKLGAKSICEFVENEHIADILELA
jgi:EAL domain-containing protein (putative c-di-GMP-specific phosphodiesterase class I)